jgi:excisionase family DNA binding protein
MLKNQLSATRSGDTSSTPAADEQPLQQPLRLEDLPPILTQEECAALLRLGRSKTYELLRQGIIPSIRLGKQYRVSRDKLFVWMSKAKAADKAAFEEEV